MTEISLRLATMDDAITLYNWRNAEETRRYSFDSEPLEITTHIKWFTHSLLLKNRYLLIAECQNQALGVLRFDIDDKKQAEVAIYLDPCIVGKGWGTRLIEAGSAWINCHVPQVELLIAKILPENIASCRAFEKSGFQKKAYLYEKKV